MELSSHRFISFFPSELAEQLCEEAIVEYFPIDTVLFHQGDQPDYLYLVLTGKVNIITRTEGEQDQIITTIFPDECLGEFAILDGKPRSAKAVMGESGTLAKIRGEQFLALLKSASGNTVLSLFAYMTQKLRTTTNSYVKELVYKDKMTLIGEMVHTILHDLRSPLSGINIATRLIKTVHSDPKTKEWCELINQQCRQVLVMAEDLLNFTEGKTNLEQKPVNLAAVIRKFIKLNQLYLKGLGVDLTVKCPPCLINADEDKLIRVLQNLIVNAVEAFKHQKEKKIEIDVTATSDLITIKIIDNGPGIPIEIQDKLFDAFVTYGKKGGTGLGTAIAKSIIDAHGGKISFVSNSSGTTFIIELPAL